MRRDNQLHKEATIAQKAIEKKNHIIFTPRKAIKSVQKYLDKEAVNTGEFEPSDEQKLLDADPAFKAYLDSLDNVPF